MKYIRVIFKTITSQQGPATKEEVNYNIKEIKKRRRKNHKITTIINLTKTREQKKKKKDSYQLQEMKVIKENT